MVLLIGIWGGACARETPPLAPSARVVRLSHPQWENAVVDLLHLPGPTGLSEGFVRDASRSGFANDAASLVVSPVLWQQYQRAAEVLADRVVHDPTLYAVDAPPGSRDAWIRSFGSRAFRHPLAKDEIAAWRGLFDRGAVAFHTGDAFADGVQAVIAGMLQSPRFLYRIEAARGADDGVVALDPYELASRLSFALWNSMPDDALFAAAADGMSDDDYGAQVDRMLGDPRARAMVEDFHRQWLHVDGYENIVKKHLLFPEFERRTPAAMQDEVLAFTDEVVFGGGTVHDLFTSRRTFVNRYLAPIYGIEGSFGEDLVPVDLDPTQRSGLLTLSGFLAQEADSETENPILRGAFVNATVLCADLPPPPASVPPLPPVDPTLPLRDQIEAHTGVCGAGCHTTLINPIGLSFQHYDALGRYRADEHGLPIDASGTYDFGASGDRSFDDALELSALLADSDQVHRCYVEDWLQSLEGRPVAPQDEVLLTSAVTASLGHQPILSLIRQIVTSDSFRYRRAGTR